MSIFEKAVIEDYSVMIKNGCFIKTNNDIILYERNSNKLVEVTSLNPSTFNTNLYHMKTILIKHGFIDLTK